MSVAVAVAVAVVVVVRVVVAVVTVNVIKRAYEGNSEPADRPTVTECGVGTTPLTSLSYCNY
jgi:hypothetical protein